MAHSTTVHLRRVKRPTSNGRVRQEWHLRWHGRDGKHYCRKLGNCDRLTKREAEKARRDFQVELDRKEKPRDIPQAMTLEEFARFHAESVKHDRKPTTRYEYQRALSIAIKALGRSKRVQDVTPLDVGKIKNCLRGSAATRAKHLSRLRAVFGHAKRWGLIHGENPFARQPMPKFTSRPMRIFSGEEIDAMLAVAPTPWWRAFLLVGLTAGLRRDEISHLMWRDVREEEQEIVVSPKRRVEFRGPDGQSYTSIAWMPKDYEVRTIPIPAATIEALRALHREWDGSPYCFLSLRRLAVIQASVQEGRRRERAETLNNLPRGFRQIQQSAAHHLDRHDWQLGTIHDLRRTFGTRMSGVVPMHVLKELLGHADISTTARYYLFVEDHHARQIRDSWPNGGLTAQDTAQPKRATSRLGWIVTTGSRETAV